MDILEHFSQRTVPIRVRFEPPYKGVDIDVTIRSSDESR